LPFPYGIFLLRNPALINCSLVGFFGRPGAGFSHWPTKSILPLPVSISPGCVVLVSFIFNVKLKGGCHAQAGLAKSAVKIKMPSAKVI